MSEIKRYDFFNDAHGHEMPGAEMRDGEWVRHADHLAAVEAAVMAERGACLKAFVRIFGRAIRARTTQPAKEAG